MNIHWILQGLFFVRQNDDTAVSEYANTSWKSYGYGNVSDAFLLMSSQVNTVNNYS